MSDHLLLTLPIAIPLTCIALCAMSWNSQKVQRCISVAGSVLLFAASLLLLREALSGRVIVTHFGSWNAPFGITFAADLLSAAMVVITGIMAVAVSVYQLGDESNSRVSSVYYPLYNGLLLGVVGSFITGDIFNLYVWFEVMLISSFGLLVIGGTREQLDGSVKYVTLNLVATSFLLLAVGFLYGVTGSLNLADLSQVLPTVENQGLVTTIAILFLIAFGAKAAVFPLFFWLPASYPAAAVPVVAIFAAMLTKVGVYTILRTFTMLFTGDTDYTSPIIGAVAGVTMVTGVLGAAAHYDMRRILSFHIISQIGYMLVGLAVGTPLAIAGSILYVIHHIIVKANLFLIAGVINTIGGSFDLQRIGGLHRTAWPLALLFIVPALSLAGLPPLSGFWAKFVVVQTCLQDEHYVLAAVALGVGVLTLYSMLKIWNEAFWKEAPQRTPDANFAWRQLSTFRRAALLSPIIALAAITLTIGLYTEPFLQFSKRAAEQLLNPAVYADAVQQSTVSASHGDAPGGPS